MADAHEEIAGILGGIMAAGAHTRHIPPPVMAELGMRYLVHEPGILLRADFPAREYFANSAGMVQGGILSAALDAAFGSLAILETRSPCVSLALNTIYHRPIHTGEGYYTVEVRLTEVAERFVYLQGDVMDQGGVLAVVSNTTLKIMGAPVPVTQEAT